VLDNKINYARLYTHYTKLPILELQKELKDLYKKRYEEYNADYAEHHRIASLVYTRRTRKGTGLIFHMNKFIPVLVYSILVCMFE
jgi:hypothetical protein